MFKNLFGMVVVVVMVFFTEVAISSGSFSVSLKKNFGPDIPIVIIEAQTGMEGIINIDKDVVGSMAVADRIIQNHRYVIFGRIGGEWIAFQSSETVEDYVNEKAQEIISKSLENLFG
jgi:hypothetical protein